MKSLFKQDQSFAPLNFTANLDALTSYCSLLSMNYFFKNSNDLFSKFVLNNVFQNVNEGCCIIIIIIIDNPASQVQADSYLLL